jgi:hypothetical protein
MIPSESHGWRLITSRDIKFVEHVPGFPSSKEDTTEVDAPHASILTFPYSPQMPPAPHQPPFQPRVSTLPTIPEEDVDSAESAIEQSAPHPASEDVRDTNAEGESHVDSEAPVPPVLHEQPEVRRSSLVTSRPDRFDPSAYGCITGVHALTDEAQALAEISRRPDKELWDDRKALPIRWMFEIKRTQTGVMNCYKH